MLKNKVHNKNKIEKWYPQYYMIYLDLEGLIFC